MRIGLIVYGLDRPLTGIGRYTLELARAMAALTPRPDVVLLSAGGLGPLEKETPFPYVPLTGCRLLPSLMTLGQLLIPLMARRYGLDLIHDPTGVTPLLSPPLQLPPNFGNFGGESGQFKRVVTIHDVFAWSLPGHSSLLDTLIYRQWLPRVLPKVNGVITVSQQSQEDIQKYLNISSEQVNIIPYGVTSCFRPLPAEQVKHHLEQRFKLSAPYLLYVGALTKRKNVERALEAFALIHEQFPMLRFVLAGPRSWKQTPIEQVIARLKISDKVHLTGPLTDEDLPALYNGASLFLFPSLYEGFGLPVLEAMACGTPVVTSNQSSLPEVVGDAAIIVDPYDVEAIADGIMRILSDKALAASLRQKGLERAKLFSWERTARETVAVYERLR